jgi:protein-arginine kinase
LKVPHLSKDWARFEAIANQYNVQIRGTAGEHSESADGTYDISNRHRLGKGECSLVNEMYAGVKAMIAAEKELAAAAKK